MRSKRSGWAHWGLWVNPIRHGGPERTSVPASRPSQPMEI
jgi:hypothetical protein